MLCSGCNKNCKWPLFGCARSLLLREGFLQLWWGEAHLQLQSEGCSQWWRLLLWLSGSRAWAQQLWQMGLAALRHMGSSWPRAWTHISCTGRQILYHWATREALNDFLKVIFSCWNLVFSPSKSSEALCYLRIALNSIGKVVNLDVRRKSIAVGAYS